MRFMSRSLMVRLTYSTAPGTSRSMRILRRHVSITCLTSRQLSRLTVSMPFVSM